jgi:hypothetical protein
VVTADSQNDLFNTSIIFFFPDAQNIDFFEVSQPKYGCDHSLLRDRDPSTSSQAFASCTSNPSRLNSVAQKLTVRMQQNMQQNSIRICYQALQTPPSDIDPGAWQRLNGAPLTNQSCVTCFMLNVINQPNPAPVLNTDAGISKVCCGRTAGRDATPFPSCMQAGWSDPDGVKVGDVYVPGCTSSEVCNSKFELVVTADSQNDLFNTSIIFFFPGDTIDVNRAFLYPRKSSDFGRFSDSGCAVSVGSDIFFANNFFFSLDNPDKTAGNTIFSYNVVTEMFTYDKYKFAYPRDQTVCQSSGYSAYFAGGIKVASPAVKAQTGRAYDVNDEVDQLEIIPSLIPGQENTFKFHYAKYKLSKGRSYLASASVGQVIAFAGGLDLYGTNAVYDNFDVLNVTSGKMSTFKMPTGRFLHACSGVVNLIVCAGGQNDKFGYIRSVDIYDTSLRNFTSIPNGLSLARGLLASGSSNTSVFFAGGFGDAGVPLANVDMFDFGTRTMRAVTPLREPR